MSALPVSAQVWLTVSDADGRFKVDLPVPFDMPPAETESDGTVILSYVHESPEMVLRLVVVDSVMPSPGPIDDHVLLVSRSEVGARVVQSRVQIAGRRTYRLSATSTPELQADPMIHRFLTSIHLQE